MKIAPQYLTIDFLGNLKEMMVIVPINPDIDKAKKITHKCWSNRDQGIQGNLIGRHQFQNHNGDNNG